MHERRDLSAGHSDEHSLPSPAAFDDWTGEQFRVELQEEAAQGQDPQLSLRVSAGEETVVFVFRGSVRD